MAANVLPKVKIGKVYPITYFQNYNEAFRAQDGTFKFAGYEFERVGRNKVKVLSAPA